MTLVEHVQQTLEIKPIPAAVVAAFLFQIGGGLYWAGTAAERIAVLESNAARNQNTLDRVAVVANDITTMRGQLVRIETKLDRIQERHAH